MCLKSDTRHSLLFLLPDAFMELLSVGLKSCHSLLSSPGLFWLVVLQYCCEMCQITTLSPERHVFILQSLVTLTQCNCLSSDKYGGQWTHSWPRTTTTNIWTFIDIIQGIIGMYISTRLAVAWDPWCRQGLGSRRIKDYEFRFSSSRYVTIYNSFNSI